MINRSDNVVGVNWRSPLNRGLIGWWLGLPQVANGLSWRNLARPGNVGTLTNLTAAEGWRAATRQGGRLGVALDGTNDHVSIANYPGFKPSLPVTVACWVLTRDSGNQPLFNNDATLNTNYGVYITLSTTTNAVQASYGDGGGIGAGNRRTKTAATSIGTNAWRHVAATVRGATNMSLYLDGVDDGGSYSGTGGSLAYNGATAGSIGMKDHSSGAGNEEYANIIIDDVRFWNRSLSADEIRQVYRDSLLGCADTLLRRRFVLGMVPSAPAAGSLLLRLQTEGLFVGMHA